MRLSLLVVALIAIPVVALPTAAAWPPVCIVKEAGSEGGKVHAEVWVTCGPHAVVTTCPKDAFCTSVSTEDVPLSNDLAVGNCHPLVHGAGFDSYLCVDAKGPIGCKVYRETYYWEGGMSRSCVA